MIKIQTLVGSNILNIMKKIDIQSNPLKILYVSGGQGIGDMYEFCQQIDFGLSNVHIKVATGKNIDLAQKINNADFRNKIEAFWLGERFASLL
jgi:hypothetical protein